MSVSRGNPVLQAQIHREEDPSFVEDLLYALSLVQSNFLQVQLAGGKNLSRVWNQGTCPTHDSQASVLAHHTPK